MTHLEWRKTRDGYESDGYLIRPLEQGGKPRWRLEVRDPAAEQQGSRPLVMSVHTTFRDAMDRASHDEGERVRRSRVTGHLIVGAASSLVLLSLATYLNKLGVFVAFAILLYVALRAFTDAISVQLGDAWGWTRDRGGPEQITWSGRRVLAAMEGLRRRSLASMRSEPPTAILMLPPDPPM
jgi:hypothetical protein